MADKMTCFFAQDRILLYLIDPLSAPKNFGAEAWKTLLLHPLYYGRPFKSNAHTYRKQSMCTTFLSTLSQKHRRPYLGIRIDDFVGHVSLDQIKFH